MTKADTLTVSNFPSLKYSRTNYLNMIFTLMGLSVPTFISLIRKYINYYMTQMLINYKIKNS